MSRHRQQDLEGAYKMAEVSQFQSIYNQSTYKLTGHGARNVQVLKEAFQHMDEDLVSDVYGKGQVIEDFQVKMAALLGKEDAVFSPVAQWPSKLLCAYGAMKKGLRK